MRRLRALTALLVALAAASSLLHARPQDSQRSSYRPPGQGAPDTVLPPRPAEPAASPPSGVAKGRSSGTGSPAAAQRSPGAQECRELLPNDWDVWWHFHAHEFLELRAHVRAGVVVPPEFADDALLAAQFGRSPQPGPGEIDGRIEPLLVELAGAQNDGLAAGALMGLARLGTRSARPTSAGVEAALRGALGSRVRGIAETAVIALGIRGDERALPWLDALVRDDAIGRGLALQPRVPWRMRSLAAYSLGLLAHSARSNRTRQFAARALILAIEDGPAADTQVACLVALGLCALEPEPRGAASAPWISRQTLLAWLEQRARRADASRAVRAHLCAARARLAADAPEPQRRATRDALLALLDEAGLDTLQREACIQGLGELAAFDRDDDAPARARLFALLSEGRADADAARLALLASAGRSAQLHAPDPDLAALRSALAAGCAAPAAHVRAWSALATGVLEARLCGRGASIAAEAGAAVRELWSRDSSPDVRGAAALALGLLRDARAGELLRAELDEASDDVPRAYAALGLGLLGERADAPRLQRWLRASAERPFTLESCALGLARLDEKAVVPELLAGLERAIAQPQRGWYALALGQVGDVRAVDTLCDRLVDERLSRRARAWLAVALGMLCERVERPWAAPIADDPAWRATSETLFSGSGQGVLEFL